MRRGKEDLVCFQLYTLHYFDKILNSPVFTVEKIAYRIRVYLNSGILQDISDLVFYAT